MVQIRSYAEQFSFVSTEFFSFFLFFSNTQNQNHVNSARFKKYLMKIFFRKYHEWIVLTIHRNAIWYIQVWRALISYNKHFKSFIYINNPVILFLHQFSNSSIYSYFSIENFFNSFDIDSPRLFNLKFKIHFNYFLISVTWILDL